MLFRDVMQLLIIYLFHYLHNGWYVNNIQINKIIYLLLRYSEISTGSKKLILSGLLQIDCSILALLLTLGSAGPLGQLSST